VRLATPRAFAIFLFGGTIAACLMLWVTGRLFLFVQDPPFSSDSVNPPGLFGAAALTLFWILPGQVFAAVLAGLFFSFFKRIPLWFVLAVLIPVCGLAATYRNVSDRDDPLQRSDYRKLLYWLLVVTPGELLCMRLASNQLPAQTAVGSGA